ncbi:MAG: porphobilinogen synthase [Candidatus Marinimicrobia bacterium]|nr:porphobilinogen synthase [Candidatus Neomarinimicrobiota bacterium]
MPNDPALTVPVQRPRRNRRTAVIRNLVAETRYTTEQLIMPLFLVPGKKVRREVSSMPGVFQLSVDEAEQELSDCAKVGLVNFMLFGIPDYKDSEGSAAWQDDGIIQRGLNTLLAAYPEAHFIADLCFCEYTDHGHCGPLRDGEVDNDATLVNLQKQALALARAGVHTVAPSGMIDGMVGAVREALDEDGYSEVGILSYAVKYASALYGPFREAAEATPSLGDRHGYQMDVRNATEALLEAELDSAEGADMLMVKPAGMYLDVIAQLKAALPLPLVGYQVSGEYAMLKAASANGWIDGERAMVESIIAIFRAGANAVITYFAKDLARLLKSPAN